MCSGVVTEARGARSRATAIRCCSTLRRGIWRNWTERAVRGERDIPVEQLQTRLVEG